MDAGATLLTVRFDVDGCAQPDVCYTLTLSDKDGQGDFEGPLPPVPPDSIPWVAENGEICAESVCEVPPNCGDDIIQWRQGETCDPPDSICGSRGNPNWVCDECCQCIFTPPGWQCGDGIIQWKRGETCDPPGSICGSRGNPAWQCNDVCQCVRVE